MSNRLERAGKKNFDQSSVTPKKLSSICSLVLYDSVREFHVRTSCARVATKGLADGARRWRKKTEGATPAKSTTSTSASTSTSTSSTVSSSRSSSCSSSRQQKDPAALSCSTRKLQRTEKRRRARKTGGRRYEDFLDGETFAPPHLEHLDGFFPDFF